MDSLMFTQRRKALLESLPPDSYAIIFAAPEKTRSNDTEFLFRQDSDFYYLTGFNEPNACLVLVSDTQEAILFCQEKDPTAEIWHGRRLGVEQAAETLGMTKAFGFAEISEHLPNIIRGIGQCGYMFGQQSVFLDTIDPILMALRNTPKAPDSAPVNLFDITPILHRSRMQKSDAELALIRRSCDIAANAHKAAMRACQPGLSEATLEAVLHYHFALEGARLPAYNSIVGGGDNACILHYTVNDQPLREGDLVLIDAGCEYEGYAADITRTFPVNGQFSPAQAELYDVVLAAQAAAIARCVAGNQFADMQHAALEVLVTGLIDLGILHGTVEDNIDQQTYRAYYMHGIGHFLGLDVHDAGIYQHKGEPTKLQPNMVLTIEPGLYIAKDSECPEQYKGIGIRIEDDVVVQHNGCEILTSGVPKTRAQIEALMGEAYRDPLCPSQA